MTNKKNAVVTQQEREVVNLVKSMETQFAAALPSIVKSDRFTRVAITCIRKNPDLMFCTQESLLGSLMTAAQLGLEPGVLEQCYLIPYNDNKTNTKECKFQLGYKGMIELLRRTGVLEVIRTEKRYSNDEFKRVLGLKKDLIHIPADGNRGTVVGYYAVAELKGGAVDFVYMSKEEIEEHEKKHRKGKFINPTWVKHFDSMAEKTVIKRLLKLLPASIELIDNLRAAQKNNTEEILVTHSEKKADDVLDAEIIDETTGEIIPSSDSVTEEIVEMFEEDKK